METNKTFKVYQASAGSGKTFTIVKEYLALCLKDKASTADFGRILAITFTNKAANEMKEKIVSQLIDIIHSDPDLPPEAMEAELIKTLHIDRHALKENAKQLFCNIIHDYSSFCICTIDAFVQKLSRAFARDLNLPSRFNVSIDKEEVADAITERIGEKIGSSDNYLTHIIEDFSATRFDDEKNSRIASSIHDFVMLLFSEEAFQKNESNRFESELQYKETLGFLQSKTKDFEPQCQSFTKEFDAFLSRHQLTTDDFNGKTRSACLIATKNLHNRKYGTLSDSLIKILDEQAEWHSKTFAKSRQPQELERIDRDFQDVFVSFFRRYQKEIGAYLFYKKQLEGLSLYVLRSKIKAEMDAYIGETQIVHITEFNKRINEILGDFSVPFIYERIGERFKHIFIDEFQDTSVLQWQNLLPLIDNSLANNNMSMIVGDGKQSIYRWRNGEVGQIVSLPKIYGKPDDNPIFNDYEDNLSNNFSFHTLSRNFRSFSNIVEFNNSFFEFASQYLSEAMRKVYADQNEYKQVSIQQQCQHQEQGFVQVELFDDEHSDDEFMLSRIKELIEDLTGKGFSRGDITILVRTNKIGSLIANYLNEHGINIYSAESILLTNSSKVQLIISTLEFLIQNNNTAVIATMLYYWNATRQESFGGDLNGFFNQAADIAKGQTSMEEVMGLKSDTFKSLLAKSYSLYDLCSALIRCYGFDAVGDAYLNFLLDVVYKWQYSDETGIGRFLEYWEKKKKSLSVLSSKIDAVNIMTVHKSKGLDFPVVIYPFVSDNIDDKKSSTVWISPEELGFEAIPNITKVQFSITEDSAKWSPQAKNVHDKENEKVRLDNLNLLYVAFTRAEQRLHILSYQTNNDSKSPLNAFLKTHPDQYGDPKSGKVTLKKSHRLPTEIFHESTSCEWFEKISVDPNPSMYWMSKDNKMEPVEWGTFVHQVLSEVQQANDVGHVLDPYVNSGTIDPKTATLLQGIFEQMVIHPDIHEAFSEQATVKNECEILSRQYGIIRPDRYAELPDKIILLDYKTGKTSDKHHQQLRQYMSVLTKMVGKPISAYLVYLGETINVVPVIDNNRPVDNPKTSSLGGRPR